MNLQFSKLLKPRWLITIALSLIIGGILISGVFWFANILKTSPRFVERRDKQRIEDLKQVASYLEQYKKKVGEYPRTSRTIDSGPGPIMWNLLQYELQQAGVLRGELPTPKGGWKKSRYVYSACTDQLGPPQLSVSQDGLKINDERPINHFTLVAPLEEYYWENPALYETSYQYGKTAEDRIALWICEGKLETCNSRNNNYCLISSSGASSY